VTDPSSIQNASCALVPNGSIKVNVTAGIAPYTYTLNTTTQTSDFFPGLSSGIYHILVSDNIGCSITVTDNVGNTPKIKVDSLNIIAPSCNGLLDGSIKVNVSLGAEPYQFAMDTGLYQQGNIFSSVRAGSHLIHIKDAYGCLIDTAITIIEPGLLTVSIISTEKSTCSGTADGKIMAEATGGSLPYQYTIDTAGISGYQSSNTFPVLAGNYTVTAKDIKGCIAKSATKVDSVFNLFLELGSDTTICSGQSITLNPASNAEANMFVYTPSSSLNNALIKNPVATPSDTITYSLSAKWGICDLTDNITVNVLHKPIAYAGVDTAICNNTKALLHGTATNLSGAVNYSWSPAAELINADSAVTPASPLETQTYTLTVTDNYGCNFSATDAVLVTVQPPVQAFAGRDTNAVTGMTHQLQATGAGPGGKYEWIWKQPGVSLSNAYIPNPTAVFQNHVYELVVKATDIATCVGYDTIKIIVYDGPAYYVPNAFTPNGDQLNQLFRAIPVGIVTTEWFRIFNRYGQLIFETNRWMSGWDGTYQGRLQPPGTYVWIIKGKDRNGRIVEQKGTVLLMR
jgi:gliding motility-associated-like protein